MQVALVQLAFPPPKDLICTPKLKLLEPTVRQLSGLLVFLLAEAVGSSWPIVLCQRQSHQPSLFMTESDWHTTNEILHQAAGCITTLYKAIIRYLYPQLIIFFPCRFPQPVLKLIPRISKKMVACFKNLLAFNCWNVKLL